MLVAVTDDLVSAHVVVVDRELVASRRVGGGRRRRRGGVGHTHGMPAGARAAEGGRGRGGRRAAGGAAGCRASKHHKELLGAALTEGAGRGRGTPAAARRGAQFG